MSTLSPVEMVIPSLDFRIDKAKGQCSRWVYDRILSFADLLNGTGACIKVNSAVRGNYPLITELKACGLKVWADLKLVDIGETLENDGGFLEEFSPDMLTVMCNAGKDGISRLKAALPNTEILGVTVLTSIGDEECDRIYHRPVDRAVYDLVALGIDAGLSSFVCSPREAVMLRTVFENTINLTTPGIRPRSGNVKNDDQARVMTPEDAVRAGIDRMVVGRPITQAADPLAAWEQIVTDVEAALKAIPPAV